MNSYYYSDTFNHSFANSSNKPTTNPTDVAVKINTGPDDVFREASWSWCTTVWSMITLGLGMFCCGITGLVCSLAAYSDHRALEYKKSVNKRRWAWICVATGIILVALIVVLVVVAAVVFLDNVKDILCRSFDIYCD